MVFENLLDPVFSPLLTLHPALSIFIISLIITVISTLAYKYLTDQKKMKILKEDLKKNQQKIKKLTKTNPDKAMKLQQEMMSKNMELMKQSFKPTLFTLIPILIIFGWLNAHLAFEPLMPSQSFDVTLEFEKGTTGVASISTIPELQIHKDDTASKEIVDNQVTWTLLGDGQGTYDLLFEHDGLKDSKEIILSNNPGDYAQPQTKLSVDPFKQVTLSNEKVKPLEGLPLIGNWGWLGIYIIFSIALSLILRKVLKVA